MKGEDIEERVNPHLSGFFSFLVQLLNDQNFKISLTSLHIIQQVLKMGGTNLKANVHHLIPGLVEKLGDNKIVIRQSAQLAFRGIMENMRVGTLVTILLPYLKNKNWHIREEILNLLSTLVIGYHHTLQVDYPLFLNELAQRLDDTKPRVRHI